MTAPRPRHPGSGFSAWGHWAGRHRRSRRELALAQHFEEILVRARAFDALRLVVFGDMAILERDPVHLVQVDAIVVLKDAAHPHRRRLAVGANTDALAGKLGRRERARRVA